MADTEKEWLKPFEREFVAPDFKIEGTDSLKPWFDKLLGAEINSASDLADWLKKYSELNSVISENANRRYVAMTCDTRDEQKKEHYLSFVRELQPKITEWSNALDKKYFDCPYRKELDDEAYGRADRMIAVSLELFSEKNIPLGVKLSEMSQEYQSIAGGWTVEFDGKKQTMPQMGRYLLKTDRDTREKAWRATTARRLEDKDKLEELFDRMLKTRGEFAANLGLKDYREYAFKSKLRDYTPDDCLRFHEAVEKAAVPLMRKLADKRRQEMGLDKLRPWDMRVDPQGRAPLEPFEKVEELQDGVEKIFAKIDPRLGERFNTIRPYMDLDSRDGKAPGGYQTTFEETRLPFIFTNAAGVHDDVITLLHEGGHAFHTLQCRDKDLIWYRHAPMEFCEVASMSQELFGNQFLDVFYKSAEEVSRARLEQLERSVDMFPWVATVDAFQHWLYTHPDHSRDERAQAWLEINERFANKLDWDGIEPDVKKHSWHRQLHIFEVPFYYIEYAIAELGSLQFYRMFREDPGKAVDNYLKALSYGGSMGSQKLFEAGGIKFDFSYDMLKSLMDMVEEEIDAIS